MSLTSRFPVFWDSRVERHHVVPAAFVPADLAHLQRGDRLRLQLDLLARRGGHGSPHDGDTEEQRADFRTESLHLTRATLVPPACRPKGRLLAGLCSAHCCCDRTRM